MQSRSGRRRLFRPLNRPGGACQYARAMIRRYLVSLLVVFLAACETPVVTQTLPELTYGHLSKFTLDVAAIAVKAKYVPPMKAPNVEHLFPTPPGKALRRWAADRLRAGGRRGSAQFVIIDAAVTETPLKLDKSFTGAFTKQQSRRYEATVEVSLEILDDKGFRKGFANARVSRSRTLGEDATINDRERMWFDLTEALMRDFNAELEKNIRQYLGGYLL